MFQRVVATSASEFGRYDTTGGGPCAWLYDILNYDVR